MYVIQIDLTLQPFLIIQNYHGAKKGDLWSDFALKTLALCRGHMIKIWGLGNCISDSYTIPESQDPNLQSFQEAVNSGSQILLMKAWFT